MKKQPLLGITNSSILAWLLAIALAIDFGSLGRADSRDVEGQTTGRYYNTVWQTWSEQPIHLVVRKEGDVVIYGGDSTIGTFGMVLKDDVKRFSDCLNKSLEWDQKVRDAHIEVKKELGAFGMAGLTFKSTNQGTETSVILRVGNEYINGREINLYLNSDQVQELINLFNKVPQTLADLRENEEKASILK